MVEAVRGAGVVVTGAGGGIGAALARRFVAEGARVVGRRRRRRQGQGRGRRDRRAIAVTGRRLGDRRQRPASALGGEPIDVYCADAGLGRRRSDSADEGLARGLGRQRDGPRPRGPRAGARLARARRRRLRLHRLGRRPAHHDRRGAVRASPSAPRSPSPSGCRSPTATGAARCTRSARRACAPTCRRRRHGGQTCPRSHRDRARGGRRRRCSRASGRPIPDPAAPRGRRLSARRAPRRPSAGSRTINHIQRKWERGPER